MQHHTTGPWRADYYTDGRCSIVGSIKGSPDCQSALVVCDMTNNGHVTRSDARLIAEAPAMLAALRQIVAALTQPVQFSGLRLPSTADILRGDAEFAADAARSILARIDGQKG